MTHYLIGVPIETLQRLLEWAVQNPVIGFVVVASLWLLARLLGLYATHLRPRTAKGIR